MSPLGKKIVPPPPAPKPDVIEKVAPGIISRNGKLETDIPPKGPQYAPVEPVYIYSGAHWDAVIKGMQQQIADGFPLNEFGVM